MSERSERNTIDGRSAQGHTAMSVSHGTIEGVFP
jgi:hypothetical protein